ncbi:MAG: aspartyl/asparaginyl beta-hydroxylase domain-containing protein, partial [Terriglobia bacterium]
LIPEPKTDCRIRVGSEVRTWEEGKSLIFDDSHPHEAWNDSNFYRVVLLVDFLRPLPVPLSLLNSWMVRRLAALSAVTDAAERMRNATSAGTRAGGL